jgi:hypothetical protein
MDISKLLNSSIRQCLENKVHPLEFIFDVLTAIISNDYNLDTIYNVPGAIDQEEHSEILYWLKNKKSVYYIEYDNFFNKKRLLIDSNENWIFDIYNILKLKYNKVNIKNFELTKKLKDN